MQLRCAQSPSWRQVWTIFYLFLIVGGMQVASCNASSKLAPYVPPCPLFVCSSCAYKQMAEHINRGRNVCLLLQTGPAIGHNLPCLISVIFLIVCTVWQYFTSPSPLYLYALALPPCHCPHLFESQSVPRIAHCTLSLGPESGEEAAMTNSQK